MPWTPEYRAVYGTWGEYEGAMVVGDWGIPECFVPAMLEIEEPGNDLDRAWMIADAMNAACFLDHAPRIREHYKKHPPLPEPLPLPPVKDDVPDAF